MPALKMLFLKQNCYRIVPETLDFGLILESTKSPENDPFRNGNIKWFFSNSSQFSDAVPFTVGQELYANQ